MSLLADIVTLLGTSARAVAESRMIAGAQGSDVQKSMGHQVPLVQQVNYNYLLKHGPTEVEPLQPPEPPRPPAKPPIDPSTLGFIDRMINALTFGNTVHNEFVEYHQTVREYQRWEKAQKKWEKAHGEWEKENKIWKENPQVWATEKTQQLLQIQQKKAELKGEITELMREKPKKPENPFEWGFFKKLFKKDEYQQASQHYKKWEKDYNAWAQKYDVLQSRVQDFSKNPMKAISESNQNTQTQSIEVVRNSYLEQARGDIGDRQHTITTQENLENSKYDQQHKRSLSEENRANPNPVPVVESEPGTRGSGLTKR